MAYLRRLNTVSRHFNLSTTAWSRRALSSASDTGAASNLRLVIIGGVAGGASAAARARRLAEFADITVIEKGVDVSFANCGMPYYIGDTIKDSSRLAVHTPKSLSELLKLNVRTNTTATVIDRKTKTVHVQDNASGTKHSLSYDKLILSTGAQPIVPPGADVKDPRVLILRSLQDMHEIKRQLAAGGKQHVCVVGAGFIGLEMAEQLRHIGKSVTLVELQSQVLPQMDAEMTQPLLQELKDHGVDVRLNEGLKKINTQGALSLELASGGSIPTDLIILSIGVRPDTALAREAQLELAPSGHLRVNAFQQTSDPDIYAIGDAVLTKDGVFEEQMMAAALAGPANRQGRLAADHIFGASAHPHGDHGYPGSLGTAIVKVFDQAAGMTGWSSKRLARANIPHTTTTVVDFNHASYYPGATPLQLKLCWDPKTGRVLGAQAVGMDGVDKRLDVLATAIRAKMTVQDLVHAELSYAPPFGAAKDVINLAAFTAANQMTGLTHSTNTVEDGVQVLDVRDRVVADVAPLAHSAAINIPLPELRSRLSALDKSRPVLVVCNKGKTSYFATRVLIQNGFSAASLQGGITLHPQLLKHHQEELKEQEQQQKQQQKQPGSASAPAAPSTASTAAAVAPMSVDCSGLACPGPLLKVKQATSQLQPGQTMNITATDAGFASDVKAFAKAQGLDVLSVTKQKGVVSASLRRPSPSSSSSSVESSTGSTAPAAAPAKRGGAAIVVFSNEMDKVLAALVMANGAAAMGGGKVTLFFTFWGLSVLRKEHTGSITYNFSASDKSLLDRMMGYMQPAGISHLPLSHMNYGGVGQPLMKYQMDSKHLPNVHSLLKAAKENGVRMIACSMSMEAMGVKHEELLDGTDVGGVADFLASASEADLKLFI